jgi:hypothetical protein
MKTFKSETCETCKFRREFKGTPANKKEDPFYSRCYRFPPHDYNHTKIDKTTLACGEWKNKLQKHTPKKVI